MSAGHAEWVVSHAQKGASADAGEGNRLLGALGEAELGLLLPWLVRETVSPGQILQEIGAPADLVHFPSAGTVLALVAVGRDGRVAETAQIGCEGAAGPCIGPVGRPAAFRTTVHVGGGAWRIAAAQLAAVAAAAPGLQQRLAGFTAASQLASQQSTACAALHAVEARAARWLLGMQDRVGRAELPVTQEYLAEMLGVRRTTITRVVAGLELRGLIRHRRGRLLVLDRHGLEHAACECHLQMQAGFETLAPGLYPAAPAARRDAA
jgi:hypothetical protein